MGQEETALPEIRTSWAMRSGAVLESVERKEVTLSMRRVCYECVQVKGKRQEASDMLKTDDGDLQIAWILGQQIHHEVKKLHVARPRGRNMQSGSGLG